MDINYDGSIKEQSFSKIQLPYPIPNIGVESYRLYRARVDSLVKIGFHLGDLSWSDYSIYCKGSGNYQGVDADEII